MVSTLTQASLPLPNSTPAFSTVDKVRTYALTSIYRLSDPISHGWFTEVTSSSGATGSPYDGDFPSHNFYSASGLIYLGDGDSKIAASGGVGPGAQGPFMFSRIQPRYADPDFPMKVGSRVVYDEQINDSHGTYTLRVVQIIDHSDLISDLPGPFSIVSVDFTGDGAPFPTNYVIWSFKLGWPITDDIDRDRMGSDTLGRVAGAVVNGAHYGQTRNALLALARADPVNQRSDAEIAAGAMQRDLQTMQAMQAIISHSPMSGSNAAAAYAATQMPAQNPYNSLSQDASSSASSYAPPPTANSGTAGAGTTAECAMMYGETASMGHHDTHMFVSRTYRAAFDGPDSLKGIEFQKYLHSVYPNGGEFQIGGQCDSVGRMEQFITTQTRFYNLDIVRVNWSPAS